MMDAAGAVGDAGVSVVTAAAMPELAMPLAADEGGVLSVPALRNAGATPLRDTETVDIMEIVGSFFLSEPAASVGYTMLLVVGTILSVVGLTRTAAGLYTAIGEGDRSKGMRLTLVLGAIMLGMVGINYAVDAVEAYLTPSFQSYTHRKLVERVLKHNEEHYLDKPPLAYRNMLSTSTSSAYSVFSSIIKTYVPNGILLAVVLFFLMSIDVRSALLFLVAGGVAGAVFAAGASDIQQASSDLETKSQTLEHEVFDVVSALDTVVTRNQTDEELGQLNSKIQSVAHDEFKFLRQVDNFSYTTIAIVTAAIVGSIYLAMRGVHEGRTGEAAAGSVLAVTLMLRMHGKLANLSTTNSDMLKQTGRYAAVSMPELAPPPPSRNVPALASAGSSSTGSNVSNGTKDDVVMTMENVSFRYPPRTAVVFEVEPSNPSKPAVVEAPENAPILTDFSYEVRRGVNGLFGRSGVGKSTAGRLLTGLYSSYEGTIRLGGTDVRDMSRRALRSNVGLSQQSMRTPNRSIRDTLLYGNGPVTEARLQTVWSAIESSFDGRSLDSMVGLNGGNLSTGQLQLLRISALQLAPQRVLVLDEPCSGVDVAKKAQVLEMIRQLGKTRDAVVLVTHDAEVAALADRVRRME